MPVPHNSSFFTGLLPNQHHQSTEGMDHIILMALQMPLPAEHKLAILPVSILSQIILWGQWLQVYTVQMFFPVTEQAASQECTELGAMTPHFLGLLTAERKDIRHNLYEAQLLVNPLPLSST